MSPWANRATRRVPNLGSKTQTIEINDYSLGFNTFFSNDKMPVKSGGSNQWRMAQDARITTFGEYGTRKGFDFHSAAAGETQDQAQASTTGAADRSFTTTVRLAQIFTAGTTGRLSKVAVRLKNDAAGTGVIMVEIWSNVSTAPGALLARTSIDSTLLTSSYAYLTAYFPEAPDVTATTSYWIVVYVQTTGTGDYKWSSTSTATTAKTSVDSGASWSATSYALNFQQYYSTTGGVKGMIRAYKSDGTPVTIFAHGTSLYTVNELTGALTAIKTGLSANATDYRFTVVNDIVYYVNGFDGYRKWDFTTESQVNATNYSLIVSHKGLMFLQRTDDPNRVDYSNFGDYETFTSTDFILVPAPKTGDPNTALLSLNGYLLIWTKNNKYLLSGDDNATFQLGEAPDQKPTFSQNTVAADKNFTYYLSDDGMYRSNGNDAQVISTAIYQDILTMNKEVACVQINQGRLYLWFASSGSAFNNRCYVWNLNYGEKSQTIESLDTDAFVQRACLAYDDDDTMMVGSSRVGQIYWQELPSNDYHNLGGDIHFDLKTHYLVWDSPAVLKEVRYWVPRFGAQDGNYTIALDYAYDLRDNWQTQRAENVQGSGSIWGASTTVWGAFTWGASSEVQPSPSTYVPGEYRRIAFRYWHYAARQPNTFLGHTIIAQTRRIV